MDPESFYYVHNLSPFLWEWSPGIGIRYYGVAYLLGFLAFYFGMRVFYKWGWSPLNSDQVADLSVWIVAGTLIGGRLGYCLAYDLEHTLYDPLSIIAFWRTGGISGMASHGGMIGVVAGMMAYAWRHRVDYWNLADLTAILASIGIFLGRVANFINGELWGRPATVPWAVIFPEAPGPYTPRHPSQLYEAFGEGLFLFVVLLSLRRMGWGRGRVGLAFLFLYGVVRIGLENYREPDAHIGYLWGGVTMGQLLSVGLLVIPALFWIWRSYRGWPPLFQGEAQK